MKIKKENNNFSITLLFPQSSHQQITLTLSLATTRCATTILTSNWHMDFLSLSYLLAPDSSETKTADFSGENGKYCLQWWGKGNPRQGRQGGVHLGHVGHHWDHPQLGSHHLCLHLHNLVGLERLLRCSLTGTRLSLCSCSMSTCTGMRTGGGRTMPLFPCDGLDVSLCDHHMESTLHHFQQLRLWEAGLFLFLLQIGLSRISGHVWLVHKCMKPLRDVNETRCSFYLDGDMRDGRERERVDEC